MNSAEILSIFRQSEALLDGHFQLTSGLHSPQYFQCAKVLQHPCHTEKLCAVIASHFKGSDVGVVIAPALGGIVVGQEVGRQLGVRTLFAERKDGAMQLRRGFVIHPDERVLVCEDVVTTGGSVSEVIKIVQALGGKVAGVGFIVDRSGGIVSFGVPQFSLLQMDVVTYEPQKCPLCKQSIPVVKPGSRTQQHSITQ